MTVPSKIGKRPKAIKFWERPHWQLVEVFRAARWGWIEILKKNHPDKVGASGMEETSIANAAWTRAKKLFAQHGITL